MSRVDPNNKTDKVILDRLGRDEEVRVCFLERHRQLIEENMRLKKEIRDVTVAHNNAINVQSESME